MESRDKTKLIVLISFAVVIAVVVMILGLFEPTEKVEIILPPGNLSMSLFDSQNSKYTQTESFPKQHQFTNIPYTIDTVDTDGAVVDTGCVYPSESGFYFYYAEVPKTEKTSNCIGRQFSKALKYDFDPSRVLVNSLMEETGFVNGFGASYQIVHVGIPEGVGDDTIDGYVVSYRLEIPESEKYDCIVGVAVNALDNTLLASAKQILDADVITIQFNDEINRNIEREEEREQREAEEEQRKAEREAEEALKNAPIGSEGEGGDPVMVPDDSKGGLDYDTIDYPSNTPGQVNSESPITDNGDRETLDDSDLSTASGDSKSMGIMLKQDYDNLTVRINWTNTMAKPSSITISDAENVKSYKPDSIEGGTATFNLGAAKKGVYLVKIKGYGSCGSFTSELLH